MFFFVIEISICLFVNAEAIDDNDEIAKNAKMQKTIQYAREKE